MKNDWVTWACLFLVAIGVTNLLFGLIKGPGIFGISRGPLTRIQNILTSTGLISMAAGLLTRGRLGFQFPEALTNAVIALGIAGVFLGLVLGLLLIPIRANYQHLRPVLGRLGEQETAAYEQRIREIHDYREGRRQARAARRQV
jgi:hypothetical protein